MQPTRSRWLHGPAGPLLPEVAGCPRKPCPSKAKQLPAWNSSRGARAMAASCAVLLAVHLTSTLLSSQPPVAAPGVGWAEAQLGSDIPTDPATQAPADPGLGPLRIPRIIHQLYNGSAAEPGTADAYRHWRSANPGWELRFYDVADCPLYINRWFPKYLDAFKALRTEEERRDFFRYMVILRHGGAFVDAGTECKRPLEDILREEDSLVMGWDKEFASGQAAVDACHVRVRQVQHRVFAAAAAHPVLQQACDKIVATMHTRFSAHPAMDAMERTGPGLLTDLVLDHALQHPPALQHDPWGVRLLPRNAFGAPAAAAAACSVRLQEQLLERDPPSKGGRSDLELDGRRSPASRRLARGWWPFWRSSTPSDASSSNSSWPATSEEALAMQVERVASQHAEQQLFPVSADFEPPFDVMTHLVTHGERQSGWDVSLALSTHGAWQPSVQPNRRPSLVEAVVGSLGRLQGEAGNSSSGAVVDVGAGYGFLTLAAAARGHKVHAFELGPGSARALEASVQHNGFGSLIEVHRVPLGATHQRGHTCLRPLVNVSASTDALTAAAAAAAAAGLEASALAAAVAADAVDLARGYASPAAHAVAGDACARSAARLPGSEALPEGERVAALRISANGWEGYILEGFAGLIRRQRPPVIAVEWNPAAMRAVGYASPLDLVHSLVQQGYRDVSHSGFLCDERWYYITYGVRRRGEKVPEDVAALRQPTWCRLAEEDFELLVDQASSTYPETLLFINKDAGRVGAAGEEEALSEGSAASDSGEEAGGPSATPAAAAAQRSGSDTATDGKRRPKRSPAADVSVGADEAAQSGPDAEAAAQGSVAQAVSELAASNDVGSPKRRRAGRKEQPR